MEGRYRRVVDLVELTDLLQVQHSGLSIDEIADRFAVSRRTAERMLRALRERYPDLAAEIRHGRKYWRFRHGSRAAPLESGPDAWTSARTLAEGMALRLDEPLAALLLATEHERDPQHAAEEAHRLAARMRRVLEHSLQLFRMDEPKPEPTDTGALLVSVTDALRPRAREAGVELRPLVTGAACWLEADRALLSRALAALVENAIEASPPGGRVRVEVSPGLHPGTRRFQVDDEGPGVDPSCHERIFEPYFTTRDEAAGLGLALARSIARRHGGRVALVATPGRGASFVLEVASCQGPESQPSESQGPAAAGSPSA